MNTSTKDSGLGEGVVYAPEAYASLSRRFLIILIDLAVIVIAGIGFDFLAHGVLADTFRPDIGLLLCLTGFVFVYLVLLEASPIGTLGFFLTGVRIVTLKGEGSSIVRMTFRLFLWLLGPINPVVDFFWLGGDEYKQALRDKLAGTYVVKKGVVPSGRGPIMLSRYTLMGFVFVFQEVQKVSGMAPDKV